MGKKSWREPNVWEKELEATEHVRKKRETTECVGKKGWREPNVCEK